MHVLVFAALAFHALWTFDAGSHVWATPAVAKGRVFVGTSNGDVFALDERTGAVSWKAALGANPDQFYGYPRGIVGGVAVSGGDVFAASGSCIAAGFDARDGRELWRTHVCDVSKNDDVYAAPVVANGSVLVGIDMIGDKPTDRGREIGIDAAVGRVRWMLYPERYSGTGTGISTRAAFDPVVDLAFIGTGNPTPMDHPPPGPDVGSDSIVAFDPRTGRERWAFGPVHPHDAQDLEFFASPNLFESNGERLIGDIDKDGTYYALDELTGHLVWKTHVRFAGYELAIGTPAQGDGKLFVPIYSPMGSSGSRAQGALVALSESGGRELWRFTGAGVYESPVYADGIVYATETNGNLDALDARTGKRLASLNVGSHFFGHGAAIDGRTLFVANDARVTAYRAADP
jgi:outer membrane protein assembly factor BamB